MGVTFSFVVLSIFVTYIIFVKNKHTPAEENIIRKGFIKLAYNKFYLDELYDTIIVKPVNQLSGFFKNTVDNKIFDRIVESIGRLVMFSGSKIRLLQTGNVGFYLFAMVISIILALFFNLIK